VGRGAKILRRPRLRLSQLPRRPQRPIRIAQELSGEKDQIGLSGSDDVIRLRGICDHPNRTRPNACVAPDSFGKFRLVSRSDRNLRFRNRSS
jgi:hypothetical protein